MPFIPRANLVKNASVWWLRAVPRSPRDFRRSIPAGGFAPLVPSARGDTYSVRKASVGDTDAARRAGITAAMNAQTIIAPAADARATGSQLDTP